MLADCRAYAGGELADDCAIVVVKPDGVSASTSAVATATGRSVIGHRGAAAVAPANTLRSLEAAVAAGADLVEFDVGGDLTLAHSKREVRGGTRSCSTTRSSSCASTGAASTST